jgi:hypothetical protein
MGDKTKVVEVEFVAQGLDDAAVGRAALPMFEQVFNEDVAHLKNFR